MAAGDAFGDNLERMIHQEMEYNFAEKKKMDKPKNRPSETAITAFDSYDYDRLVAMGSTAVMKIEDITDDNLAKIALLLQALIRKGKLYMMDKEDGGAWPASVVIGYNKGGLLIAHER